MATEKKVRIAWKPLRDFAREAFIGLGVPAEDAGIVAEVLIWANLRGVDSHGVQMVPAYAERLEKGVSKPKPDIRVVTETPATMLIDADRAFGAVVTAYAMSQAIEKASKAGIGLVFIRGHTHQGAIGYYARMAARRDMAGIIIVSTQPSVAPYGAKAAGLATNPVAISVPAKHYPPMILDMATSVVAKAKIRLANEKGIPIPEGWALDKDGNPTTSPKEAAIMLPLGGPKGSGLSTMFECLSSIMVGNPLLSPVLAGERSRSEHIQNSALAAINISLFTDLEDYKENIDNLINELKALPRAKGFSEILVPGEPEEMVFAERSQNGIPIPESTISKLRNIGEKLGIKLPTGLA